MTAGQPTEPSARKPGSRHATPWLARPPRLPGLFPLAAGHGSGLKIIDAVTDNLRLSGNGRSGTTVHFEKALDWVPGAPGEHLVNGDG